MTDQFVLHWIFVFTFLAFTGIRMVYHRRASRFAGKATYIEGRKNKLLRGLFGVPYILMLFVYMVYPQVLEWAAFPLPGWARWTGAVLSTAVLPVILWIQWALGDNFATTLHVREKHTLVTHGPYRWVRHPMYTIFFIQAVGLLLLTANAFIGGIYIAALTLVVVTRVQREEMVMLEKFGEDYRSYMIRTGRFLPRFRVS